MKTSLLILLLTVGGGTVAIGQTTQKEPATRPVQGVYTNPVGNPVLPKGTNRPRRLAADDSVASPNYGPPQTATTEIRKRQAHKNKSKNKPMKPLPSTIHP